MALICPKCQGEWRQYERNGVTVDQCTDCRGIFLDRGELDRLVDAENNWHGSGPADPDQPAGVPNQADVLPQYGQPPGQQAPPPYKPAPGQQRRRRPRTAPPPAYPSQPPPQPGYGYPQHGQPYHKKRKKSFLDELFD